MLSHTDPVICFTVAEEVEFGLATLKEAPPLPHHEEKPAHESEWFNVEAPSENMTDPEKAKAWDALTRKTGFKHNGQRYKPTLQDLDRARYHCRLEMGKILNEVWWRLDILSHLLF